MRCVESGHITLPAEHAAELEDGDRVARKRNVFMGREVNAKLRLVLKLDADAVKAIKPGVRIAPNPRGPRHRRLHPVLGFTDLLSDALISELQRIERKEHKG